MSTDVAKKSAMTLHSDVNSISSHCLRILLRDKDVECDMRYVNSAERQQVVDELNPYGETPVLIDREMVLYEFYPVVEYLDERFPHPPLLPADPIGRGKARLTIARMKRDWINEVDRALIDGTELSKEAKQSIRDGLTSLSPLFNHQPYFTGDDYTLVDVIIAPLLWRLKSLGIDLPEKAQPIKDYASRLFAREQFETSLSQQEMELNEEF
ncbi:MAG: RNA polymerase-associated protein [Saprospiraceae bacterium]|jgi:RNA polymerase-associated protein